MVLLIDPQYKQRFYGLDSLCGFIFDMFYGFCYHSYCYKETEASDRTESLSYRRRLTHLRLNEWIDMDKKYLRLYYLIVRGEKK